MVNIIRLSKYAVCAGVFSFLLSSCDNFFDVAPHDAITPATFWKTEADAEAGLTACYNWWFDQCTGPNYIFFNDCMSDISFNRTGSSSYKYVATGELNPNKVPNYYKYESIARCNVFLANIGKPTFADEEDRKNMIAQVRVIRAWEYLVINYWFGGIPLITEPTETAEAAQVERSSEEAVRDFIYKELDEAIPDLPDAPAQKGRIAKGTALAIKMRAHLYYDDWETARQAANDICALNLYELEPDFIKLFSLDGQSSKEIIYADQHIEDLYKFGDVVRLYNNQDGGWASFVPTQNLVDMFEMKNGLMPEEEGSGYDERHPFADRDPRLYNTVVYPGMDWEGKSGNRIINTLDKEINGKKNADYYDAATNASATGMIYAKYALPTINQYSPSLKNDRLCPILFRYAEVLLTIAECNVELNENLSEALDLIDQLRQRGGHIKVDRSKYNTQDKIRELVRRERTIELAGEGLRRQDILRWKDKNGKMVAETVMNGPLYHMVGTIDYSEPDPTRRAVITPASELQEKDRLIENRKFEPYMRYWPIPQAQLEKNPKLVQNPGYN
ncbi:RagB/SusD family nutrient uptake outer membrane protein [Bacteroides sp. ET489]|uniref:RagB/SusD family nutrient uptake outer membrane protein n=1 Tax=Bacteroides sp. ET489 TaxID=3057126 RepID=UPI0026735F94|nr:RagB/SusD family nutrient uptake outer membrane protein [Bacteroides sp. ET489]MDO3390404.1 RagB/SusD family nutrient uptake outer membrane protein [Bacteroides sp. ET489]